jgi:hypothetical protein
MELQLKQVEKQIEKIKQKLLVLGPIRPGSLTKQYRLPEEKKRPFYQLSYTYHMRSRSEYVRPEDVAAIRKETVNFKRFKGLIDKWVELELAASQLRIREGREKT